MLQIDVVIENVTCMVLRGKTVEIHRKDKTLAVIEFRYKTDAASLFCDTSIPENGEPFHFMASRVVDFEL